MGFFVLLGWTTFIFLFIPQEGQSGLRTIGLSLAYISIAWHDGTNFIYTNAFRQVKDQHPVHT
jgi:hypothetical protein